MGIAAMAQPLVEAILTNKWAAAVPILQITCFVYMLYPIHLANLQIAKAVGRTDISMRQEIAKSALDIAMLVLMVRWGLVWVAIGLLISSVIALWINIEPNNQFIHYNTLQQLWDVFPSFIVGLVTSAGMYAIGLLIDANCYVLLGAQILTGVALFFGLSYCFNRGALNLVKDLITKTER